jgi:hypothetical protein
MTELLERMWFNDNFNKRRTWYWYTRSSCRWNRRRWY